MKTKRRFALVISGLFAAGTLSLGTSVLGCAAPRTTNVCIPTTYISPTTVTLDHTIPGNSQLFTTGISASAGCPVPATNSNVAVGYTWNVSDTVDATISSALGSQATASCTNAALNPITVYTTVATYPAGSSPTGPPTYVPSGLPSATLICK